MSGLLFLSPLYLVGIASAAIPLLIHLSRSRRTRKLRFSTTRFLTEQFLRSYRMSRLKELLLLAARMALFALLAATFARPFMRSDEAGATTTGGSRAVVIVLDDSASMSYREDGVTLLSRAATAARAVVESLEDGDTVAVVLAGRRATGLEVLSEPTPARNDVLALLEAIGTTADAEPQPGRAVLGTDLTGAVVRAEKLIAGRNEKQLEVYVFSDLQQRAWAEAFDESPVRDDSKVQLVFVGLQPRTTPKNFAVTAVQYGAARPMAGIPFAIRAHVRNDAPTTRPCTLSLYVRAPTDSDDATDNGGYRKVAEREIREVPAGQWSVLTLHHTFHEGGWQAGYVEVEDPALLEDNRRYFTFEVLDTVRVLAVNGAPSSVRRSDEMFFLEAALAAGDVAGNSIDIEEVSPDRLAEVPLANTRLVILANVESLSETTVTKLEGYVDGGGSLMVFLGDQAGPGFYNRLLAGPERPRGGLLPARLAGTSPRGDPTSDLPIAGIGEFLGEHPLLAGFDTGRVGTLSGVTMTAFWNLEIDQAATSSARVLMWTRPMSDPAAVADPDVPADPPRPLLCERRYGQGRVMMFASSCDRDWTNFPVRPAFLPWIYRLVGYLSQERAGYTAGQTSERHSMFQTGDTIREARAVTAQRGPMRVRKPDGSIAVFAPPAEAIGNELEFTDTVQPGVYRFDEGNDEERAFVVNLEAAESDLSSLLPPPSSSDGDDQVRQSHEQLVSDLVAQLPWADGRLSVADPQAPSLVALAGSSETRLWDTLLWIVLFVALLEPALANWITRQHYLKSSAVPRTVPIPTGRITLGGEKDQSASPVASMARPVREEAGVTRNV